MSDISKISTELLKFRENHFEVVTDQTFITISNLVNKLYFTAKSNNLWWYPPKLSIGNADGTVLLEWERNDKVLFVEVLEDKIEYNILWGLTNEELYDEESGDIAQQSLASGNIENTLLNFWSRIGCSDSNYSNS